MTNVEPKIDYQALMDYQDKSANFRDMDEAFWPLYEQVKGFTMTSTQRLFDLYKTVEYIAKANIPGSIVECGVWQGGSMMLAALTLLKENQTDRGIYLFDTFEGHPQPLAEHNNDIFGGNGNREWFPGQAKADVSTVTKNMRSTGYPMDNIHLYIGLVEQWLPKIDRFIKPKDAPHAIVRLDTDWYETVKIELEILWPRITLGGFLIIDDYGHYFGQRKAVDEYFANRPVKLTRIDYSCRVIQKI